MNTLHMQSLSSDHECGFAFFPFRQARLLRITSLPKLKFQKTDFLQMQDIKASKQSSEGDLLPKHLVMVTKHFASLEDAFVLNERQILE